MGCIHALVLTSLRAPLFALNICLQHLLGLRPSYGDIDSLDPEYYKSLKVSPQKY